MTRYLVVGGAGFIGSHLVEKLLSEDAESVTVVDNFFLGRMENLSSVAGNKRLRVYREDARYLTALENIIKREDVDTVFNLAVKPLPYTFVDPEGAFSTGVEIVQNLASLLRRKSFKKLIHFSSSEVYGDAVTIPMSESHPLRPTSPYGAGKAAGDLLLSSFHMMFSSPVTIVRPFNTYGPRQNPRTYAAVVPLTIRRILTGEPPVIEWDGLQTRDLTFVTDIVGAAYKLSQLRAVGQIVNVGQGKEFAIKDVVGQVCRELGYTGKVVHSGRRPADFRRHLADIRKARSIIGYEPKVAFKEGIHRTVSWFKKNRTFFTENGISR